MIAKGMSACEYSFLCKVLSELLPSKKKKKKIKGPKVRFLHSLFLKLSFSSSLSGPTAHLELLKKKWIHFTNSHRNIRHSKVCSLSLSWTLPWPSCLSTDSFSLKNTNPSVQHFLPEEMRHGRGLAHFVCSSRQKSQGHFTMHKCCTKCLAVRDFCHLKQHSNRANVSSCTAFFAKA